MSQMLQVACVQLNNTPDMARNMEAGGQLVRRAAADGARLVCTPEYSCLMRAVDSDRLSTAAEEEAHAVLAFYRALAAELGIWLLVGSLSVRVAADRMNNRSFLLNAASDIVAHYDKIHLFDVDLPNGESFRESDSIAPGERAVVARTPWGGLGMTVCYDIRFPALYRTLAQAGAAMIAIPAAFSALTGEAHWELFCRARAAETGCFILAPGQCGHHENGRRSFGHSLIVDPWGRVLAQAGEEPGVIAATLDLSNVDSYRAQIPALRNARPFKPPPP